MKISETRTLILALLSAVILSGCMTMASHLFTLREQVCEFDKYFSVQFDRGVEVTLEEPVLLESELLFLMGAPPTNRMVSPEGMVASYVFEQIHATSEYQGSLAGEEFEIMFLFSSSEKGYLLSGVRSSEIPEELIESVLPVIMNSPEMAKRACDIPVNLLSRSVVLEVDRESLDSLPARHSIISWLGPPLASGDTGNGLSYEFQLKGNAKDLPIARIEAGYEQAGDFPTVINASFTRYQASIDVPAGSMRVKLHF